MSDIIDIMKQTMKKKSVNSENVALSFPVHVKMKRYFTAVKKCTILST